MSVTHSPLTPYPAAAAPLPRHTDWPTRLATFVESRRYRPFAWGSNDCWLFAADAIVAMTGRDFGEAWRGTYSSALEAARRARRFATNAERDPFGTALWPAWAGLARLPLGYAGRGDLVLVEQLLPPHRRPFVFGGIHVGSAVAAPGPAGLVFFPRSAWRRAWRV